VNEAIDLTRKNVDRANTGFLGLLHTDEERAELTTKLNALLAERARLETVISERGIADAGPARDRGPAGPKKGIRSTTPQLPLRKAASTCW
jgi:hypothetical protein